MNNIRNIFNSVRISDITLSLLRHFYLTRKPNTMSFLHSFSPIPSLSTYPGPYSVGTEDLEIPLSSLPPSTLQSAPDPAITTISFRIFYPCADSDQPQKKPVYWLPEPQDEHFQAYARFMQASPWLASLLRHVLPSHLPPHPNKTPPQQILPPCALNLPHHHPLPTLRLPPPPPKFPTKTHQTSPRHLLPRPRWHQKRLLLPPRLPSLPRHHRHRARPPRRLCPDLPHPHPALHLQRRKTHSLPPARPPGRRRMALPP